MSHVLQKKRRCSLSKCFQQDGRTNIEQNLPISLTYEKVGSRCRLPKLLFHVFGFEGQQANEGAELEDGPTKEQKVGRSSQQALQRWKKPCRWKYNQIP